MTMDDSDSSLDREGYGTFQSPSKSDPEDAVKDSDFSSDEDG